MFVNQAQIRSQARVVAGALVPALCGLFGSALAFDARAHAAPSQAPSTQEALQPLRYARAASSGARLYNLRDVKAEKLVDCPAGTLLAVWSERAGWLEVEPPAGLEVWVFGQFVQVTDQPGTVEISGNSIFMRPLPNSSEKSYPLVQRLDKGERVRVLGRADVAKPLDEDWVRIATPAGTRAWVQVGETTALGAGEDGASMWAKSSKEARAALPVFALAGAPPAAPAAGGTLTPASAVEPRAAEKNAAGQGVGARVADFDQAEKLMAAAVAAAEPDYKPVRAAYQKLLEQSPDASYAPQVRLRLEEIAMRQELLDIKAQARSQTAVAEAKRQEELEKAKRVLEEASLGKDPLWGRFQARGWLERDGERWVVRWSGQTIADVVCTSGRYDITKFAGCEVGVSGKVVRAALPASSSATGQPAPAKIDAARIEVISGRPRAK